MTPPTRDSTVLQNLIKGKGAFMRLSVAIALGCLCTLSLAVADPSKASIRKDTNIPAESLDTALQTLATTYDFQVLYRTEIVQGLRTKGASGTLSRIEALGQVLDGTGLSYKYLDEKTVTVFPGRSSGPAGSVNTSTAPSTPHDATDGVQEGKTSSGSFRLAQATQGTTSSDISVGTQASQNSPQGSTSLSEIIVTAQKRQERLQDVPASISVISGQELVDKDLTSLTDYASYIPGLNAVNGGTPGQSRIVIRGISTGDVGQPPLVGTYVDDVPIGSSTGFTRGSQFAVDLLPYDLDRIEVLKGPQGTLYGASTMGGLVKYVLRDPDLQEYSGSVGGGFETINNSGDTGWTARASATGPIINNELGFRISAYTNYTPGYIDDVGLKQDNVNHDRQDGGHASFLWRPSDALDVKLSALLQHNDAAGFSSVVVNSATLQPLFGRYMRDNQRPDGFTETLQDYALTAHWHIEDFATLTNAVSYSRISDSVLWDASPTFGPLVPLVTGGTRPAEPVNYELDFDLKKWTEELRLESPSGRRFNWMLGFFYTHEESSNQQTDIPYTSAGTVDSAVPLLLSGQFPAVYSERALFADVTYKITDRLDVSAGLRYARNDQTEGETEAGVAAGAGIHGLEFGDSSSVVTWSASSSYHVQPDAMFYVRVASGYRPGGPNAVAGAPPSVPATYGPDKLVNYEFGFKSALLDKKLQFDADVFYINWRDIQLTGTVPPLGFIYTANSGSAVSRGLEFTTQYQLFEDLRLGLSYTYTEAFLTADAPVVGGKDGDQLPGSPKNAASLTADYHHRLGADWSFLLGGAYIYRGVTYYEIQSAANNVRFSPMDRRVDLYTGVELSKRFTARFFVKNLLNEVSYNNVSQFGYTDATHQGVVPDPPRTLGVSFDVHF
jgi:iron complex outermembrane recepter protein